MITETFMLARDFASNKLSTRIATLVSISVK